MTNIVMQVCSSNIPGLPKTFVRFYLDEDGKHAEIMRTAGCDRHLVTGDGTRHFCLCGKSFRELNPKNNPVKWACLEVCDYQKQVIRNLIAERGKWMETETLAKLREFLERQNTVNWE